MSNIFQALPFYLNQALGTSDTSFDVRGLKDSRGNLITAMPSGVARILVTIEPQSVNNQEIISFTGITNKGNGIVTLTGVTRNLNPVTPFTALTANVTHANNSVCIISNNPQFYQDVLMTNEARTVTAVIEFATSPTIPSGVNPTEPVNKSQLDLAVLGTVPAASTTVLGAVRVASSPNKTLGTVTMTIASPCVLTLNSHGLTLNDTVTFTTTSALPTGIVAGTTYYVISAGLTANDFEISLAAGGSAVNTSGSQSGVHTLYRTTPYAINDQDPRLPTQDENDAMAGTAGTPSSSNKYVTNDDTTGTGAVVRQSALSQGVSFPMAEAFTGATSPQPAVLIDDLNQNIFDTTTSFGAAGSPMVAIKTIPYTTLTVTNVTSEMLRATDPGTNMTVEIQTDNAGVPSGTVITNGTSNTVATSTLNTYYKTMTFTFSTPPTLTAGTTYHFVFKTSATNANQITMLGLTNADKYANFVGSSNNGASWSSNAIVPVLNTTTVGASYSLWRADGDGKKLISGFHGFVITTGSAAASGTFVKSGVLSGFTGLTTGADYFVSNTIGTLTTTRQGCLVGKAVSSTQIDIVNSKFGQIIAITPAVTLLNNGSGVMISQVIKIPDNGFVMGTLNATYMNAQQYLGVSLAGVGVGGAMSDAASNGGGGWSAPCRKGDSLLFSQGVSGIGTSPSFGIVYFQSLQ